MARVPTVSPFPTSSSSTAPPRAPGSLFNLDDRVGSVGRLRPALAKRMGIHPRGVRPSRPTTSAATPTATASRSPFDTPGEAIPHLVGHPVRGLLRRRGH
ncbi:MAG: hypothetical protein R2695_03945 [Acidimicrobiales bacterium]